MRGGSGFPIWPCSRWGLPCRRVLPPTRCALTAPFHPCRSREGLGRSALCCTFRGLAPPRRYLAPDPPEPGLSSTSRHCWRRQRLPGRLSRITIRAPVRKSNGAARAARARALCTAARCIRYPERKGPNYARLRGVWNSRTPSPHQFPSQDPSSHLSVPVILRLAVVATSTSLPFPSTESPQAWATLGVERGQEFFEVSEHPGPVPSLHRWQR
jgi:hypothetical protein